MALIRPGASYYRHRRADIPVRSDVPCAKSPGHYSERVHFLPLLRTGTPAGRLGGRFLIRPIRKASVIVGRAGSPLHARPGSSARGGVQRTARPTSSRHH